jgi:hypothetical protein
MPRATTWTCLLSPSPRHVTHRERQSEPVSRMASQPYIPPLIGWLYDLILWLFSVLVNLFFREVQPQGSWKVPRRGPMILVVAPHANQVRHRSCNRAARFAL